MNRQQSWTQCKRRRWTMLRVVGLGMTMSVFGRSGFGQTVATQPPSNDRHAMEQILMRPITVRFDHLSLIQALNRISRAAKVVVQYQEPVVRAYSQPVSIDVAQVPLGIVLEHVLSGTKLRIVPASEGDLAVVPADADVRDSVPSVGIVAGRVVDSASGRALDGATVKVAGTKIAALTADGGQFTLRDVPIGRQVLTTKIFGYRPMSRNVDVTAAHRTTIRVSLASVPNVLAGVVTTATGVQRKLEVGNDITTLNVDSVRQTAPITSVTDLLESRVPGLTVLHSSGTPGDPSRIRIRGASSINGNNDPIVIIDGIRVYSAQSDPRTANLAGSAVSSTSSAAQGRLVNYAAPSPLDQIDPSSIETIEVLKGPSASSLYGSDAANGVIVITTKRGQSGPTHWNATVAQGLSSLPGDYPIQTVRWAHNSHDGGLLYASGQTGINSSFPCGIEKTDPTVANGSCDEVDSVTYVQVLNQPRWSPFAHGNSTDGNVTASGGVAALTYSLTGNAMMDLGYLQLPDALADAFQQFHGYAVPGWAKRPDQYKTWGGSGQVTAQVNPTLQLTLHSNLFHGLQQRSSLEDMIPLLTAALDTNPCTGTANCYHRTGIRAANAYERATDEQLTFQNALSASWNPWTWLPLTGVAGLAITTGHDVSLLPRDFVLYTQSTDTLGRYGVAQKSATVKTLNLNTTIPGWHNRLQTAVGLNLYTQNNSDLASHQDTLSLGVNAPGTLSGFTSQASSRTTTLGWFFEPRFNLSQRFYLTPGFRLDGGTANGKNASSGSKLSFASLFPKVNFSWVALDRQESDAKPLFGVLTLLRPRLALGSAGVQPAPGDQLRLIGSTGCALGLGQQSSAACASSNDSLGVQTLGNTHLRPERSSELEGGADVEAWHGRVSMTLTHARKMQHDAIISVPVAPSVYGGGSINLNVGEIRNTSTEVSGSMRPIETGMVSWTIGGNLTRNDNVVIKLDQNSLALTQNGSHSVQNNGIVDAFTIDKTRIAVGYPLFGRWELPILGYADANGDGVLQRSEIQMGDTAVYLGRVDPAVTAAVNTDLSLFHGRLGVHANFEHQGAYSQLNAASSRSETFLSTANAPNATFGQQASYVEATAAGSSLIGLAQTVSSWRFQSLSINYAVPTVIVRRFRAHRMSVMLQGANLGLWTNYRGKDPNVNAYPNGNSVGDFGQVVQPRTWSLQLAIGN